LAEGHLKGDVTLSTLKDQPPIFVVGYMHSGTTLLLNILNNHPDVFCPKHETKYFMHLDLVRRHISVSRESAGEAAESFVRQVMKEGFPVRPPASAKARPLPDTDAALAFRRALESSAQSRGHSRWAEKTPGHIYHTDRIADLIPDAIFIEVVRDPRDVLASKKTRKETVWTTDRYPAEVRGRKHLQKSFDPLWDSLAWKSAIHAGSKAQRLEPGRYLRVRYEDLVLQPEATASQICEFAGLDFTRNLLNVPPGNPADPERLDSDTSGVVRASIGRWEGVLTKSEAYIVERVCREQMLMLGYSLQAAPKPGAAAVTIVGRSLPELVTRLAHRWRLGGGAYVAAVLRSYVARLGRFRHARTRN
jgi:omega-hydroxy-beta-dihydromenaquinone-9 sulfotransferase